MVVQGSARAASSVRLTKPVDATKGYTDPQRTFSAPSLLVDPSNPKVMVAGTLEFRTNKCQLLRSSDGGKTWGFLENPPQIASIPFCLMNNSNIFQAPIAWGRNNTLYMATQGYDATTRSKRSVLLFKSTNLGNSWTSTIAMDARQTSGPTQVSNAPITDLVVDSKSGPQDIVYVGYRQGFPNAAAPNSKPNMPSVSVSMDGGATFAPTSYAIGNIFTSDTVRNDAFSARTTTTAAATTSTAPTTTTTVENAASTTSVPSTTTTAAATTTTTVPAGSLAATPNQAANFGAAGNAESLTLDDKGNIYDAFMTSTANVTPSPPPAIVVSRSSDHGKTWTSYIARDFSYENRQNPRMAWTSEGGPNGTLHLVYEGAIGNASIASYADVFYIKSTDMGKTWSTPVRLADDNPQNLAGKYLPYIQVAPNQRIDVVWWDVRDDPGIRGNDVYYTYSFDNGNTWAKNIRVTDQTVDRRFGVWSNNFDQNSPPGLTSTNAFALMGWDDTRFSTGPTGQLLANDPVKAIGVGGGVQDVFVAAVQFNSLHSGASTGPKYALAAAIGLVIAGLVILLVAMSRRRRATAERA